MEAAAGDPDAIGLYGRLTDRFGDNGLISIVLGRGDGRALHMDLWLMSCRVLKREMENAMLDVLAQRARARGLETIVGYYLPTAKNSMVADFYSRLGFSPAPASAVLPEGATVWTLGLAAYTQQNTHIKVLEFAHA